MVGKLRQDRALLVGASLVGAALLRPVAAQLDPPQPVSQEVLDDNEWWNCSGVSAGYADAKYNGTATIPFYGEKHSAQDCRSACEADDTCNAFLWSGASPHISPTHQDWKLRCYGRRDTKWVLTPMLDEISGCNHQRNPATCPDPRGQPAERAHLSGWERKDC